MARIRLELQGLVNKEAEVEAELTQAIRRAVEKRIALVEIIMGHEGDRMKKHILLFLEKPEIKKLYYRLEKGEKNSGRLFVHFRHRNESAYH